MPREQFSQIEDDNARVPQARMFGETDECTTCKAIDLGLIAWTYRSSPTCLSEPDTPQLARRFLGVLCGLFSAILVAVQINDCEIGFLAGVDGYQC